MKTFSRRFAISAAALLMALPLVAGAADGRCGGRKEAAQCTKCACCQCNPCNCNPCNCCCCENCGGGTGSGGSGCGAAKAK